MNKKQFTSFILLICRPISNFVFAILLRYSRQDQMVVQVHQLPVAQSLSL